MINNIKVEICVGNIADGLAASQYPIDRIELNSALELDGLTPSLSALQALKKKSNALVMCMVRCRGGDFCYSEAEYDVMYNDAIKMLENGADGLVFGFLDSNNMIDEKRTSQFVKLAHDYRKEAVFHKAFDELEDLQAGIETLIKLKVDRILTNGKGNDDLIAGCQRLKVLQEKYGDLIEILPGGGINQDNINEVIEIVGCNQVHFSSKKQSEGGYLCLDEEKLSEILNRLIKE